jgi:hypothetical protein
MLFPVLKKQPLCAMAPCQKILRSFTIINKKAPNPLPTKVSPIFHIHIMPIFICISFILKTPYMYFYDTDGINTVTKKEHLFYRLLKKAK